ncbi:MAG: hypothetical protein ACP6IY_20960 [Promethearchaeia archaeon]
MKKVKVTIIREGKEPEVREMWSEECPKCGKIIEAYTRKQVKWRMELHQLAKKRKNEL